ncbi:MAG: HPr family phosphocarrier protein [Rickettsiales bacterium]|nr:HPr family phosphocarrier protein [Rickettsiales bacterium]
MAEITVEIINKKGLHARAAAKFVKVVAGCDAQVRVTKIGGDTVPGGSILGLMMLGAEAGTKLTLIAEGMQAAEVLEALRTLIGDRFGEAE